MTVAPKYFEHFRKINAEMTAGCALIVSAPLIQAFFAFLI
ncbi:hypothetical protein RV07_GL004090 [Enterococcus malodoratus]|nr:hypothetical protein RV07_GL004090 [Enterococcus malodoratus]